MEESNESIDEAAIEESRAFTSSDILKFEIDKTYATCEEAQKKRQNAINQFLILLTTLALVTFSSDDRGEITIPLIGLELSKWYAVDILSILSCAAFFRLTAMHCFQRLLEEKLYTLLAQMGFERGTPWNVNHPSLFEYIRLNERLGAKVVPGLFVAMVLTGGFVFPIGCGAYAGWRTGFAIHWVLASVVSVAFLTGAVLTARTTGIFDTPRARDLDE